MPEASYIVFCLPPRFANIGKRLIISPKLYFYDAGLAVWLVVIKQREHLAAHPLCGPLFENLAVLEVMKTFHNAGEHPDLHFYRDSAGNGAGLVLEHGVEDDMCVPARRPVKPVYVRQFVALIDKVKELQKRAKLPSRTSSRLTRSKRIPM